MGAFVVRRVLLMLLILFLIVLTVFVLFSLLPSDPARLTCGKACTPQIIEINRHKLGLDMPVLQQFWLFLKGLFVGRVYAADSPDPIQCTAPCLGYSFKRHELVTDLIAQGLPATVWLALGAFVIWMTVGILAGIVAALNRGKWQDKTAVSLALIGYSLPAFLLGLPQIGRAHV